LVVVDQVADRVVDLLLLQRNGALDQMVVVVGAVEPVAQGST